MMLTIVRGTYMFLNYSSRGKGLKNKYRVFYQIFVFIFLMHQGCREKDVYRVRFRVVIRILSQICL